MNWRNCGCKREGLYWYNWRTGHPLVWKHKCWSCVDAPDCLEVLRGPSVGTTIVLVSNIRELSDSLSTAAIMSPSLAAVSTVRERRAFTSSIAIYSSCLTQTLLQFLKRISVRVSSSTVTGTSTSTRLLHLPRISSMSPFSSSVCFTVIRSQHSAAVHCCL